MDGLTKKKTLVKHLYNDNTLKLRYINKIRISWSLK